MLDSDVCHGKYQETNIFLKVTIACSFIYLLLDVTHYLWDTCSYHAHAQNMVQCTSSDYFENEYKPADVKITQRSFVFFISKVAACFAVSAAFLLGMFIEPLYGEKNEQSSKKTQIKGKKHSPMGNGGMPQLTMDMSGLSIPTIPNPPTDPDRPF